MPHTNRYVCLSCSPVSAASSSLLVIGVVVGLSVFLIFISLLLLLWRYKKNKGVEQFLKGSYDAFLKIIILFIWCNIIC